MKLNRNRVILGIICFGIISNLLVYFNIQFLYLRAIFSFIFLITTPGFLTMLIIKIRSVGFWKYLVYTVGLSISILMFGGLLFNWALPFFGITQPLSLYPLMICFNSLLLIFMIIAYFKNEDLTLKIQIQFPSTINLIFFILPFVFTIISVLGTISLNNNISNSLTMVMLGGIAFYIFFVVIFRKKINKYIYPWSIFLIGLSLLLMFSLRSYHIMGYDVSFEYQIFQLTKQGYHWSMQNLPGDAYNACLSITILPTIFSSFLNIRDEYIYKLIFQLLFAITPVIIYLLSNKYYKSAKSLFPPLVFITQPWFFNEMPALARQEIALLFFSLTFLVMNDNKLSGNRKLLLYFIFGFSIIISHYSSTYIWLAILTISYVLFRVFRFLFPSIKNRIININPAVLAILFLAVFLWNSQLTRTSKSFRVFISETGNNMLTAFSQDMVKRVSNTLLFSNVSVNNNKDILEVYQNVTNDYSDNREKGNYYSQETYKDYVPTYINERVPSLKVLPKKISDYLITASKCIKIIIVNAFTLWGLFIMFLKISKKDSISYEIKLFSFATLPIIAAMMILPAWQMNYNSTRLFMQVMIILSLVNMIGGFNILSFFKNIKYMVFTTLLIIFFLYSSGFTSQVTGDQNIIYLNQPGINYDPSYTYDSEISSALWLLRNQNKLGVIYADSYADLRLSAYGLYKNTNTDVYPSTITKDGYVYLSANNYLRNINYRFYKNEKITFTYPIVFLNRNKNLVYSNGKSVIYK